MFGLDTDLYELTMAAVYLRRGMTGPATFSLFVRDLPPQRGFLVAAGLGDAMSMLQRFRFEADHLDYLRSLGRFREADLAAFKRLRFTGDVWAVPEGRAVFAGEPLLEVTAPIAEAQLVETLLLNTITFQTAIASKAVRSRLAAPGAELIDFAARRTHGLQAADVVARASAIAGFAATSNVAAARRYGLRPAGTMAHSFVQAFPDEASAFTTFATEFPGAAVFLVDTYDTVQGVRAAIDATHALNLAGPVGIRLDSGDLAQLAATARRLLDSAGLAHARIVASGGLDEYAIDALVSAGAPIDAYGVGTKMGVSADAAFLDSAYKLVTYGDRAVMKLSEGKATEPGPKQVYRAPDPNEGDLLALRYEPRPDGLEPLLVPVMRGGARLVNAEPVAEVRHARQCLDADLQWLPPHARRIHDPQPVHVRHSHRLTAMRQELGSTLLHRQAEPSMP